MEEDKDLQPLKEAEIKKQLENFPGWKYRENKLIKELQFNDFSDGLEFLNQLIPFCNKIDHHPNVHIYYRKFIFELSRAAIGGKVTDRDFTVAKKIEEIYRSWPK